MANISVLMTVYNGLPYINEAVASVRRQSAVDWQLIIVNDGSNDGTADWLDALDDPRIRVVHQANAGAPAAANRGLQLCEGEFVARLDADDVALPRRLELQRDFLRSHPRVGLVGTQVAPLGTIRAGKELSLPLDHAAITSAILRSQHGLCHSSVMARTRLLKQVGGYWERGVAEDSDLFMRIAEHAELANLPELLLHFRILPGSLQSRGMAEVRARFAFVAEKTRRRREQLPALSYEEFCQLRAARPWWQRAAEKLEVHCMAQYRKAQSEYLGTQPALGYARLAWAAACYPPRTWQRLRRVVKHRYQVPTRTSSAPLVLQDVSTPWQPVAMVHSPGAIETLQN